MFYNTCTDSDRGSRFSVGYQVNENIAAEVSHFNAGKTTAIGPGIAAESISSKEWQFSGVGILPIGNGFSVLGRFGLSRWEVTDVITNTLSGTNSATGTDILWGVGGKFDFNSKFAARVQYDSHSAGDSTITGRGDIKFLSAGLVYKF